MKQFILIFVFTIGFTGFAKAQQNTAVPIFVSPYQQNTTTYNSPVPTVVRPKPQEQSRDFSRPTPDANKWQPYDMANPLQGTTFGRITREIDYYDSETGVYYNQYDYMSLLARRGNLTELQEVATYLQTTGVFDPAKYQAAMQAARNETTLSAQTAQQGPASGTVAPIGAGQQQLFIVKPQNTIQTPQKIHRGYDGDSGGNKPIFIQ